MAARGPRGVTLTVVDQAPAVSRATYARYLHLGWRLEIVRADALEWLAQTNRRFDVAIALLFLHHFERDRLRPLLARVAACADRFIACEPRRSVLALAASHAVGLLGASAVTRHDAVASVRAGFANEELSALWPAAGWRLDERRAGPFLHHLVACST